MALEDAFPNIPEEVMDYLLEQKVRERKLSLEKELLKERLCKMEEQLKLLEGRDDDLTCTIATGNVYQLTTVRQVRDALTASVSLTMEVFLKAHRKLLRLQRQMQDDHDVVCDNLNRIDGSN
ncbi:uncharacterized protein [Drosophila bipectinata]|uniref:uncharacterized protein n=1 Tax=Drosophila bipectinata TaxID=42026 RepID=UPI0007E7FF44|nr:uncharacterized protein LOC108127755 [Drosophila bipectinata]